MRHGSHCALTDGFQPGHSNRWHDGGCCGVTRSKPGRRCSKQARGEAAACAVTSKHISLGQADPAVAAEMGPRPEQRLMWPGRTTNKPVKPGDSAIFDTDAD